MWKIAEKGEDGNMHDLYFNGSGELLQVGFRINHFVVFHFSFFFFLAL
jgi:hypothetical protein